METWTVTRHAHTEIHGAWTEQGLEQGDVDSNKTCTRSDLRSLDRAVEVGDMDSDKTCTHRDYSLDT